MRYDHEIDANKIPIKGLVPEQGSSEPSSPATGQLFVNTSTLSLRTFFSSWRNVVLDNDTRLTDGRAPSGSAGGDLSGSYPNPSVANQAITLAKIADSAKDGTAGVSTLRSLGTGSLQALPGTTTLDQLQANNTVQMNGNVLANLNFPSLPTDAANKGYVDNLVQGIDGKEAVRAASVSSFVTSGSTQTITNAPSTLDGVALANGDRVLYKDGTVDNGIYSVTTVGTGSNGLWTRSKDADTPADIASAYVFVTEGTVNANIGYYLTTENITFGTTSQVWTQFSGAGQITAGAGLTKTGSSLDVVGTTNRVSVAADSIDISPNYVGQASITTVGTITTGVWSGTAVAVAKGGTGATDNFNARINLRAAGNYITLSPAMTAGVWASITHNLLSNFVGFSAADVSTAEGVSLDWKVLDENTVQVRSAFTRAAGFYRLYVTA